MLSEKIKEGFKVYTSLTKLNYNEPDKIYISFHDTQSVSTLLSEKELEKLIEILTAAKQTLHNSNVKKGLK